MKQLHYTLLSDGSSDRALMPILSWLLVQHLPRTAIQAAWADLGRLPRPPKTLSDRIQLSVDLYPCDVLFVHRDAEREPADVRYVEIRDAVASNLANTVICVVPVRMLEAWLLTDLPALRHASGNPSGSVPLSLPKIEELEQFPDPKEHLFDLLRIASALPPGRRKRLKVHKLVHRVAELVDDFSTLRGLAAFRRLEEDIIAHLQQIG
jgi:hypothetical protein